MIDYLKPIQEKRKYYEEHPEIVDDIMREGTAQAHSEAKKMMSEVRKHMLINYFD